MNRTHRNKLLGIAAILASVLAAQVYASPPNCLGYTDHDKWTIIRCSPVNGCGSNTELPESQASDNCQTYCCPADTVVYYDSSCLFHTRTSFGKVVCCLRGDHTTQSCLCDPCPGP